MIVVFTTCLFVATALLAAWISVRFPQLAPASVLWRAGGMLGAGCVLRWIPIFNGSYTTLYLSVFLILLPLLTFAWLHTLWVMQAVRDATSAR